MAYIRQFRSAGTNGTSITPPTFTSTSGDLIVMIVASDAGGITWGTPTGYTAQATQTGGFSSSAIFTKVAGASETPQSSSHGGSSYDVVCWLYVVADVDSSTPVDVVQIDQGSTQSPQAPNVSTTVNDCLLIYYFTTDTGGNLRQGSLDPSIMWKDQPYPGNGIEGESGWSYQASSGAIHRPTNENNTSRGCHRGVIAIASDTGLAPAYCPPSTPPSTVIAPLHGLATYPSYGGGNRDISGASELNADINGVTFAYNAGTQNSNQGLDGINDSYYTSTPSTGSAIQYWGSCFDFTSVDLSSSVIVINIWSTQASGVKGIEDNGIVFGLRSGTGEYRIWPASGQDASPTPNSPNPVIVDVDSTTYRIEDKGTFDSTTCQGIFFAAYKAVAGVHGRSMSGELHKLNTNILVGGNSTAPGTFSVFIEAINSNKIGTVQSQKGASGRQFLSFQELQIGNGSDPVYFADPNTSLEFMQTYNSDAKKIQLQRAAGSLGITLYGVSGDTIDLSNIVMSCENDWYYTIHASSTSAATWTTNAHTVIGATVTLRDIWTAQGGITFTGCAEFTAARHNSADLSGGCTIDATTGSQAYTVSGASEAALQTSLDNIANCTFSNNAIALRIEYTGATADLDLDLNDVLMTSNTVDVHYNSTNSSALTVNLLGTSNATTSGISGSATSVTFVSNPVTTEITVEDESSTAIENARVLLWATTNDNYFFEASVTITGSGTTATVTHTTHGLTTGDNVIITGANEDEYNGAYSVTVTGASSYTYTTNETVSASPATGTIKSTFAFINGLTNVSGVASDTRALSTNQAISGWVRKSTSAPYYKQGTISGTINSSSGFSSTVQMVSDE